jgi:hypothetical protein
MSVTTVGATDSTSQAWWAEMIKRKENEEATGTSASSLDASAVSMDLSPMGQMMSKLSSLATSDPDKFKEVTAGIAEKLEAAAKEATGKDAEMLSQMASQFSKASESGDVSDLKPPKPPDQAGYDANGNETQAPPPPPEDGDQGGPSSAVKSVLDEIFSSISSL